MTGLPRLSGRRLVSALGKFEYEFDHQRGIHIVLRKKNPPHRRLVVPDHNEVAKGTLRTILRQAGLTVDELRAAM